MKTFIIAALLSLSLTTTIQAQKHLGGGFVGATPTTTTVSAVLSPSMKDDTIVFIEGQIVSPLGDEKYIFKDATGEIIIEIDDEDWRGLTVQASDIVLIEAEVDTKYFKPNQLDVNRITLKR